MSTRLMHNITVESLEYVTETLWLLSAPLIESARHFARIQDSFPLIRCL
jgi:hypothetical protein